MTISYYKFTAKYDGRGSLKIIQQFGAATAITVWLRVAIGHPVIVLFCLDWFVNSTYEYEVLIFYGVALLTQVTLWR